MKGNNRLNFNEIKTIDEKNVMNTYNRLPVGFVKGEGVWLWDTEGKKYLDFVSGIGVNILGHSHPKVVEAICRQAGTLMHTSNLYYIEPQDELAELINGQSFSGRCFFGNSGAEANEGAFKLARKYHFMKGKPRDKFVCLEGSFHGRTFTTLTATGQPAKWEPFMPVVPGFTHVPLNDTEKLSASVNSETAAVMLEVIQGESGVNPATDEFLKAAKDACEMNGALLIIDEVQTGLGRTGKFFAFEHSGVEPDILTLAKGLANGVPIGAVLASPEVASAFAPGDHASTFGGNFLACSAAIATLKVLLEEDLPRKSGELGAELIDRIKSMTSDVPMVADIRGKGLLIGVQLKKAVSRDVVIGCLERDVIVNAVTPDTVRLIPPLVLEKDVAMEGISVMVDVMKQLS